MYQEFQKQMKINQLLLNLMQNKQELVIFN